LLKKYELGAAPGGKEYWTTLHSMLPRVRLYISHNTGSEVVDADSGAIIGSIPDLKRVHGIALVPDLAAIHQRRWRGRGSCFRPEDLESYGAHQDGRQSGLHPLRADLQTHLHDEWGKAVIATVIDPATETVVATIPMGGRPEYAVADGRGMIYDNIEDKDEVVALDSRTNTVKARWPIAPSGRATAMEMDVEHRRLFIGGRNKVLAIMDADSGKVLQTFPIGDGVDTNIYEPKTALLFTATREGTCTSSMKTRLTDSA